MDDVFYEDSEFDDLDSDEMFRDPNNCAYEKEEVRTGPPLSYVAEKFRKAMELTHFQINSLTSGEELGSEHKSQILSHAQGALRYQLTGYLALCNMLALVNDEGFFDRIEDYSYDEFSDWLDRIDQQGTITDS